MTSAISLHEQVVEQARLLVRLLGALEGGGSGDSLSEQVRTVAELMFEGFEELHEALREKEPSGVEPTAFDLTAKKRDYAEQVEVVRQRARDLLPDGATVAVVTRGDANLVQLPGLACWHFPQDERGVWAGFHPATGLDALAHLDQLRNRGARYLLIPGPSLWWLDFYIELRDYLKVECHEIVHDGDLALYGLPAPAPAAAAPPDLVQYVSQVRQFLDLTEALLPSGSTVAVVTRGDPALLDMPGVRARHFPSDEQGAYSGHPADSEMAMSVLAAMIEGGAQYLAIPAPHRWWKDAYPEFGHHLRSRHTVIADQSEVGVIYQLLNAEARTE